MIIRKCNSCGAVIKVLDDCNCDSDCGFICCGKKMETLVPNSVDAASEKHIPTYEVEDDIMTIKIDHVMDEAHYIKWISIVDGNNEITFYLEPGDVPIVRHQYIKGAKIYVYCNLHNLWETTIE